MGYVEKTLLRGEIIIYRAKLHYLIFSYAAVLFLVGVSVKGGGIFILLALALFAVSWINYVSSEFVVTNMRVIIKTGFIRRSSLEIMLQMVESTAVDQSLFGRIFDFGSVTVSGSGGSKDVAKMVSAPLMFRKKIQEQIGRP